MIFKFAANKFDFGQWAIVQSMIAKTAQKFEEDLDTYLKVKGDFVYLTINLGLRTEKVVNLKEIVGVNLGGVVSSENETTIKFVVRGSKKAKLYDELEQFFMKFSFALTDTSDAGLALDKKSSRFRLWLDTFINHEGDSEFYITFKNDKAGRAEKMIRQLADELDAELIF